MSMAVDGKANSWSIKRMRSPDTRQLGLDDPSVEVLDDRVEDERRERNRQHDLRNTVARGPRTELVINLRGPEPNAQLAWSFAAISASVTTDARAEGMKAGVRVIMITGDYGETARRIGKEVGIEGALLNGAEIELLDDAGLHEALVNGTNIFSRATAQHKHRIVEALQKMGHTVAMTGDGVNDAPALKKANIGVAVGSGTDVAKEAADFVLLDNSFTHIINAIEEGRGVYDNIQKSIMLLLSGNLGEVLIIFLAVLFGMNLPLTAILLLWINMVTDGAPALAYSVDPYGRDIMQRQPKPREEGLLPVSKLALLAVLGCAGTAIALTLFYHFGGSSDSPLELMRAQTMVFNFIVLYEVILVFVIRSIYRVPFLANPWVWAAAALSIVLQLILMYTPLATVFRITPLAIADLAVLSAAGLLFLVTALVYRGLTLKYHEAGNSERKTS